MPDTIRDKITALVRNHIDSEMKYLPNPDIDYSNTDNLRDKLDLDELDFLEIIMHLEDQLQIEVPDQDYHTVDDFVNATEHL